MATRLCVILYNIVTLAMFMRVSREFHCRWFSIDVTLLVLWNLPGCSWLSFLDISCLFSVCGDQKVKQY